MHVENVRSVIEELEREYTILSDKLNEHEKQTDGKFTHRCSNVEQRVFLI